MKRLLNKTLLNDHFILVVILINSVIIYIQESGINHPILVGLDMIGTLIFLLEMITKQVCFGFKRYWRDGWNRMDGILVLLSLPSLIIPFFDVTTFNFSVILTLRLMRVIRFLRVFHFFPNMAQIGAGLKRALSDSGIVLIGFGVLLVLFGLINCSLYREVAPQYFDTPIRSIYSVFRVFTVEGWYEIPDAIAAATTPIVGRVSRLYFCLLLSAFGILGLSFINSVFVDAMVADNNDDVKVQLTRIEEQQKRLNNEIKELKEMLKKSK